MKIKCITCCYASLGESMGIGIVAGFKMRTPGSQEAHNLIALELIKQYVLLF